MLTYNRMPTAAPQNVRVWLTMTIHIRIPIFGAAVCTAVVAIDGHPAWGRRGTGWHDPAALCTGMSPDVFYPPEGLAGRDRVRHIRRAKEICLHCPVLDECRSYALAEHEAFGIWGATTPQERRAILSGRQ